MLYLNVGEDDDALLDHIRRADKSGIDSPFGWPIEFAEAVAAHSRLEPWRGEPKRLMFRETDRRVIEAGSRPLSVSTDRIGITAMRCARLLDSVAAGGEPVDRSGAGKVVEVYPAAALRRWGLTASGYKRVAGRSALAALLGDLVRRAPWLEMSEGHRALCASSDDAFDALVASLIARAAAIGATEQPPAAQLERARREGWIHLPAPDSLDRLTK